MFKHDHDLKRMAYKVGGSWLAQILDREYSRWGKERSPGEERLLEHIAGLADDLCQGLIAPLVGAGTDEQIEIPFPNQFVEDACQAPVNIKRIIDLQIVALQHIRELEQITSNKSVKALRDIVWGVLRMWATDSEIKEMIANGCAKENPNV